MSWRLKIQDPVHGECWSSEMTKDRAIAFARDLVGDDAAVVGMESDAGEVLDADAVRALIQAVAGRGSERKALND